LSGNTINIPNSRFLQADGKPAPEWLLWLINPSVTTLAVSGGLAVTSGGTGLTAAPPLGALLTGTGTTYTLSTTLPASAFPALSGDVTTTAGSLSTTLATVNGAPGSYGSGTTVATYTVTAKGLVTGSGSTPITGAPGSFTVVTGFGCNGKAAQTSAAANAAISATAGAAYTATEQTMLNDIKALLNQIRAALVADGIMV